MPDLRINNIDPNLLARLKIAAVKAEKTLRQFVIDSLDNLTRKSK
jgi:hypothetical protein